MNISVQMIPVYRVADSDCNAWIFLFLPVSFYLAYCQDYHNSRLSLFIIVRSIIQFDFETYVINISENIAIEIPV